MLVVNAWWFEPAGGALKYGDGRKPVTGETHSVECRPILCEQGLHASLRALDALKYAESNVIWRVELSGEIVHGDDKTAATHRKYIQRLDIEDILFQCACRYALSVIHLWDAPPVVRQFLETGDKSFRDAAWAAARDAAWAAAGDAARDAARAAAWDAARAAARAAAGDAAWAAAWAAARAAAGDAARAAAWDAARAAARAAQNHLLETLILQKMEAA